MADLQDYDAILGKPWLDTHDSAVDWNFHIVTLHKRGYTVKQLFSKKLQQQSDLTSKAAKALESDLLSARQIQHPIHNMKRHLLCHLHSSRFKSASRAGSSQPNRIISAAVTIQKFHSPLNPPMYSLTMYQHPFPQAER